MGMRVTFGYEFGVCSGVRAAGDSGVRAADGS